MRGLSGLLTVVVLMVGAAGLAAEGRFKIAYSTYLGGNHWEEAREVIPYPDGSALVGAHVCSKGLPTTPGCFQPDYAGEIRPEDRAAWSGGTCTWFASPGRRKGSCGHPTSAAQSRSGASTAWNSTAKAISSSPASPLGRRSTTRGCFQTEVPPVTWTCS